MQLWERAESNCLSATATSITRLFFLANFGDSRDATCKSTLILSLYHTDTHGLVDNAPTVLWSAFELNISLICACLPAIRPLIGYYFPNLFGSTEISVQKPWQASLTPPDAQEGRRAFPKRGNRSYQSFIMDRKYSGAKDRMLEEDELELRQYESWIWKIPAIFGIISRI